MKIKTKNKERNELVMSEGNAFRKSERGKKYSESGGYTLEGWTVRSRGTISSLVMLKLMGIDNNQILEYRLARKRVKESTTSSSIIIIIIIADIHQSRQCLEF